MKDVARNVSPLLLVYRRPDIPGFDYRTRILDQTKIRLPSPYLHAKIRHHRRHAPKRAPAAPKSARK